MPSDSYLFLISFMILRKATILSSGKKYTPDFGRSAPYFFLSFSYTDSSALIFEACPTDLWDVYWSVIGGSCWDFCSIYFIIRMNSSWVILPSWFGSSSIIKSETIQKTLLLVLTYLIEFASPWLQKQFQGLINQWLHSSWYQKPWKFLCKYNRSAAGLSVPNRLVEAKRAFPNLALPK